MDGRVSCAQCTGSLFSEPAPVGFRNDDETFQKPVIQFYVWWEAKEVAESGSVMQHLNECCQSTSQDSGDGILTAERHQTSRLCDIPPRARWLGSRKYDAYVLGINVHITETW